MNKTLEALEKIKNIPILSTPESDKKIFYDKHKEELDIIESTLKELEKANYFLGVDVFTFIEIMNPFHNIYVWDNHNKQIIKLYCYGARRTYDGKQIYINNMSCTAWVELKDYGNTWSLNKKDLIKKWLNNKEKENGRK